MPSQTTQQPAESHSSILQTGLLLISSAVPIVGVLLYEWDIVLLIALMVIEGVVALSFDCLRVAGFRDHIQVHQSDQSRAQKVMPVTVLGFQGLFVLFFGIVLMVYVVQSSPEDMRLFDRLESHWTEVMIAIALMGAHQVRNFYSDWKVAGQLKAATGRKRPATSPIYLRGGGYAILYFFAMCLTAIADAFHAGVLTTLVILITLNTIGHLLMIWAGSIERWLKRTGEE